MERFETVIVGGGQAGLAAGYELKKRGRPFVILEANERIGDSWRKRWDSLRLFTPAKYDGLPGMRFPAPRWSFPTKDEMGDYLEAYTVRFELPVETGVSVDRVYHDGDRYVVESGHRAFAADNVIVATGAHRVPKVPPFVGQLDPRIVRLHSADYRNPGQLREGAVLFVGVAGARNTTRTNRTPAKKQSSSASSAPSTTRTKSSSTSNSAASRTRRRRATASSRPESSTVSRADLQAGRTDSGRSGGGRQHGGAVFV